MSRRSLLLTLWLISDVLLFIATYAVAYFIRVGWIFSSDFPFDQFLTAVVLAAPLWLLGMIVTRTFALTRNQSDVRNIAYIVFNGLIGIAVFTLTYYFLYTAFFSRLLLIYAFVMQVVVVWAWHVAFDELMRRKLRRDPPFYPTLIVGVTRKSRELIKRLNRRKSPLTPVAVLDGTGVKDTEIDGVPVLGKLNKLEETLREKKITHLIQASDLEQSLNLLSACRANNITYMLLPSVLGIVERDERVESLEGYSVTMVSPESQKWGWFFR